MKKLLKFLEGYRKEAVLAPLFKMLEAGFELLTPLVVASIIDVGIAAKDRDYVIRMSLVMVGLGLIGLICSVIAQYFSAKAAVGFSTKMKRALFGHIQQLSFQQLDALGVSTLVTRMTSDANQVQTGVNLTLRLLLRSPFIVFGATLMACAIDLKSARVFFIVVPLLAVVVFAIMLVTIPMYQRVQKRLDGVTSATRETLTGTRVIRAFGAEEAQLERFQSRNEALAAMQNRVGKISGAMNPATYALINAGVILLLWTGALRVDAGAITQGQLVALYNYLSQILVELIKLANLIITVTKAVACVRRIGILLDVPVDVNGNPAIVQGSAAVSAESVFDSAATVPNAQLESDAAVVFEDVSFRYGSAQREMLSHISFFARAGERIGIIGGTGAGKSTLVQLICGAYPATAGRICINGRDIASYSRKELNQLVAVTPQQAQLFSGTIRSNLLWGKPDATEGEMLAALKTAQADTLLRDKAGGLDAPVAQGGKNLSGGQRQRLTIARALLAKAPILILDDSASALDYATDAALRKALQTLSPNPLVFIVSQRTVSIQNANRILVLDDGHLVGMGTHEQLLESCPVYQEIYASQFSAPHPLDGQPSTTPSLGGTGV